MAPLGRSLRPTGTRSKALPLKCPVSYGRLEPEPPARYKKRANVGLSLRPPVSSNATDHTLISLPQSLDSHLRTLERIGMASATEALSGGGFVSLSSQVGGHPGVLSSADGSVIIKPCLIPERDFYERLQSAGPEEKGLRDLRPLCPAYHGTVFTEGEDGKDEYHFISFLSTRSRYG